MIMDFRRLKMQNFDGGVSAGYRKNKLWMRNFTGEYLRGIERTSCGCVILLRSICKVWKTWSADAKFAEEVSSSSRKGKT